MPPQPKRKAQELFERINRLYASGDVPSFTLERWKSDAEQLMRSDAYGGSIVRGALASLEFDIDSMHHWHRNAIQHNKHDPDAYRNYAVSLEHTGLLSNAAEMAKKSYELEKSDLDTLNVVIRLYLKAGYFRKASNAVSQWSRLEPNAEHPDANMVYQLNQFAEDRKLSDESIHEFVDMCTSVFRNNKVFPRYVIEIKEDEESNWVTYNFLLRLAEEQMIALEANLEDVVRAEYPPSRAAFYICPRVSLFTE